MPEIGERFLYYLREPLATETSGQNDNAFILAKVVANPGKTVTNRAGDVLPWSNYPLQDKSISLATTGLLDQLMHLTRLMHIHLFCGLQTLQGSHQG